jgi:tRNA nucleotidyltransferase (CCA-adding enzyme)
VADEPTAAWAALESALGQPDARAAVELLRQDGVVAREMPELEALFGVPQRADKHPEIDSGLHSLMSLEQASLLSDRPEVRFGALVHDIGKGLTPPSEWPSHKGHEERGVPLVEAMCRRLGAPDPFRELGMRAARWHGVAHHAAELRPGTLLDLLEAWGAIENAAGLEALIVVGWADKRGRTGQEQVDYPPAAFLREARCVAAAVDATPAATLRHRRLQALAARRRQSGQSSCVDAVSGG